MEKDMNQYVLSLLENYPQMIRKIELMRYELRFAKAVTPQEMIEVMTYAQERNASHSRKCPATYLELH